MIKYYEQLLDACEETGIKMLSDSYCCQLLALVYVFGNEDMIFQDRLGADIKIAQKRLNIFVGATPNEKLIPELKKYIDEVQHTLSQAHSKMFADSNSKEIEWNLISEMLPQWARDIEQKYKTKFRR